MANASSLRKSQLFVGAPESIAQQALNSSSSVMVERSCFYHTDEPATCLFVLVSGRVKLLLITPKGYRVLFRLIGPGDFFGYQTVFNNSSRYFTTAEAAVDSEALCWWSSGTKRLLASDPAIAVNALSISLKKMQEYQERLVELASESVPCELRAG